MHQIYLSNGDSHILNQIPYIFYSSVIPAIINLILKQLSLSENNILRLKKEKNIKSVLKMKKKVKIRMKIKFNIFFVLSFLLLLFF